MPVERYNPDGSDPPDSTEPTASSLRWNNDDTSQPEHSPGETDPEIHALLGLSAGGWKLVEYIGGGAMGRVFRARCEGHHKSMAVKVLFSSAGDFEGRLQEALNHPNIVRADGFGLLTDRAGRRRPYILMELLGRTATLDQWRRDRRPTLDEMLSVFSGALRGVAHAHALGLLHHDLKPANILVDPHGVAKVADFGLAQLRIESGAAPAGGTRSYQSPEQCELPAEELDARSDVYALGVTLFELLTGGELPLPVPRSRHEAYRIKREYPPRLSLLPPGTPRRLRKLLGRALAPERERRFEDAGEMARAMDGVRNRSAPERAGDLAAAAAQRRPRAAGIIVAIVVSLIMAGILTTPLRHLTPYEGWFLGRLPAIEASTAGAFEQVRIVRMPEPAEMDALGAELGIENVSAYPQQSWRPLHGAFIEAMADAGARVTALDLYFRQVRPQYDEPLARSIEASLARGVPVVIGTDSWIADAEGKGELPQDLWVAGAQWGALPLDFSGGLPLAPLASQPPGEQGLPGFALAVYAAAIDPQNRMEPDIEGASVRLRFWQPTEAPGGRRRRGAVVHKPAASVQSASIVPEAHRHGRGADWMTAYAQRAASSIANLDAATLHYADLLRASPADVEEAVGRRVLVVVDPGGDIRCDIGLERPVLGGELLAGAVEHLLLGHAARWAPGWAVLLASLPAAALGAVVGALLLSPGRARPWRRLGAPVTGVFALALLAWIADAALLGGYQWYGLIILPVTPIAALLAAAAMAMLLVSRSRRAVQPATAGLIQS